MKPRRRRPRLARWVIVFVPDERNIPKKIELAHRKLQEQGVRLFVYDIDFHADEAKKRRVKSAPTYIVMEKDKSGFNDGMFAEPYEVRRTPRLSDIQKWSAWISNR